MRTKADIIKLIEEEDVEFIRLQFTDMFGNLKNLALTTGQIERILDNKITCSGKALYDDVYFIENELYLYPDPDSFVILPWRPQQGKVGKFICDICDEDGNPIDKSPRAILKRVLKEAKDKGYTFTVDPNCEFFLFHTDENGMPTTNTYEQAGYMDVGPQDFGENARRDMVLMLEEMGFEIESSHHEKAPAQHEIDFTEAEGLSIADSLMTFKFAVRSIAKRFGLYATFMPKPKTDIPGSGLHLNIALYKDGKNVFKAGKGVLTDEANYFMGGIMAHAKAMCAITNPIVNSYKRLMSGFGAPRIINWASGGENPFIRLRATNEDTRVELRFPDPAANPYLTLAIAFAAGLDGIENKLDAGPDFSTNKDLELKNAKLPENLKDAVVIMHEDSFMNKILGKDFVTLYTAAKYDEWNEYMKEVTDWEINRYLIRF